MVETGRYSLLRSFAEHRQALMRFLTGRLGNPALAQDLAHETWVRAANSPDGAIVGTPRSYLFQIASNLAIDHQRGVGHRAERQAEEEASFVANSQPSPENIVLYRSEFARLVRMIDGLSPRCREVFMLCKFDELDHVEIADRLNISRSAVVGHVVKALAAIEREMDPPQK